MSARPLCVLAYAFLSFFASIASAHGTVVFVNITSASQAPDGTSWSTAWPSLQQGLAAAAAGDEVWVSAGTYSGPFTLGAGIGLYGGFAGTETPRTERDPGSNVTVLTGIPNSVLTVASGAEPDTVIDGLVFRNGYRFTGPGGALDLSGASPTVRNNRFEGNRAQGGGAIACSAGAKPVIEHNVFTGNTTSAGTAISCAEGSDAVITNNVFTEEIATNSGSVVHCSASSPLVANNLFKSNSGGAIHMRQGGAPRIINNTFVYNASAIHLRMEMPVVITNNLIAFNQAGISFWTAVETIPFTVRNNCVYGSAISNYLNIPDPTGTDGNISVDPKLASRLHSNWHIQPDSPCRDAGDGAAAAGGWADMDGEPRVQDGSVDIGADESDGTLWPVPPTRTIRVRPYGDDAFDGSTWEKAKRTVGAAAAMATLGDEIWVAGGVYSCLLYTSRCV